MFDVSFVMTVYNKEPYLPSVLKALGNQEGDFTREFIFVDDGSSDNSLELVREATKDWDNVTIIAQENAGISMAINRGCFEAKGEYIKVCDSDDSLTPFATRGLLELMKKHKLDYLCSRHVMSDDVEADLKKDWPQDCTVTVFEKPLEHFIKYGLAGSSTLMLKTSSYKEVGGADPDVLVQDVSIPLRLSKNHQTAVCDLTTVIAPREIDDRMLSAHATVVYTMSANMYHFLRDNPDVEPYLQRIAFKRSAGRAWKWAKRHHGASMFSKQFGLYLLSQLPIWSKTANLIKATLSAWDNDDIRHPPHMKK